ncbi:MAG: hypothetical protein AAFO91_11580, partial [Bacteroidota bacterium]
MRDKKLGESPADFFCVPHRNLENCKVEQEGVFCLECDDTFAPVLGGSCEPGTVPNCLRYDRTGCIECEADFFLNSEGSGTAICADNARTKSDGDKCLTKKIDSDACQTCKDTDYLDGDECKTRTITGCFSPIPNENKCELCDWNTFGDTCQEYTANNCKFRNPEADQCLMCAPGYKTDNSACVPNDFPNCETWLTNKNKCASCDGIFYMGVGEKEETCIAYTATGCKEFDPKTDVCSSCSEGYIITEGNCVASPAANCKTYDDQNEKCLACSDVSYFKNDKCDLRSVADCAEFSNTADADTCSKCSAPTYMKLGVCTRPTEKKCFETEDQVDTCKKCLGGWTINGSNQCLKDTSERCFMYTLDGKCERCESGKYLDNNQECVDNIAENCETKSTIKNECLKCKSEYWMDSGDNNKCKPNTAENCGTKSQSKNECSQCK